MANRLLYDLRSDGVLYSLAGSISALVKRKSPTRTQVEMWRSAAFLHALAEVAEVLTRAHLLSDGCHRPRGQWKRRRREHRA